MFLWKFKGGGHGGGSCISRTQQLYQYGGRGGSFCHLLFNKCDISCSDNTDFQICINGDTVTGAPQINPNWGGVEVSQDSDLATFHKNMHTFTCGCCCVPYTTWSGLMPVEMKLWLWVHQVHILYGLHLMEELHGN